MTEQEAAEAANRYARSIHKDKDGCEWCERHALRVLEGMGLT